MAPQRWIKIQQLLTSMVPGLEQGHFADLESPIQRQVGHGLFQGVSAAITRLNPAISRSALLAGPSWIDVFSWLEAVELSDPRQSGASDRPPRGSYQSPGTRLRPLNPVDIDSLYHASLDPRSSHRWRFRGRTPSPSDFHRALFGPEVLCQYIVTEIGSENGVGLVVAYDADLTASHVRVALQRLPDAETSSTSKGLMIEGFFVFAQYLFDHFDFAKLYMEVPEYNMSLFDMGPSSMLTIEGRLRNHFYYGDRLWDFYYLALYRTTWESFADYFRGVWPLGHFEQTDHGPISAG